VSNSFKQLICLFLFFGIRVLVLTLGLNSHKIGSIVTKWASIAMESVRQSGKVVKALRDNVEEQHFSPDPMAPTPPSSLISRPKPSPLANWITFAIFVPHESPALPEESQVSSRLTAAANARRTPGSIEAGTSIQLLERDVDLQNLDYLQIPYTKSDLDPTIKRIGPGDTGRSESDRELTPRRPLEAFEIDFIRGCSSVAATPTGDNGQGASADETPAQTMSRLVTQWTIANPPVLQDDLGEVDKEDLVNGSSDCGDSRFYHRSRSSRRRGYGTTDEYYPNGMIHRAPRDRGRRLEDLYQRSPPTSRSRPGGLHRPRYPSSDGRFFDQDDLEGYTSRDDDEVSLKSNPARHPYPRPPDTQRVGNRSVPHVREYRRPTVVHLGPIHGSPPMRPHSPPRANNFRLIIYRRLGRPGCTLPHPCCLTEPTSLSLTITNAVSFCH
jgi:hypothetical protein